MLYALHSLREDRPGQAGRLCAEVKRDRQGLGPSGEFVKLEATVARNINPKGWAAEHRILPFLAYMRQLERQRSVVKRWIAQRKRVWVCNHAWERGMSGGYIEEDH